MCRIDTSPPISPSLAVSLVPDTVRCTPNSYAINYTMYEEIRRKQEEVWMS